MKKVYLRKNDDYKNLVDCNFGMEKEILYKGSIYAFQKKNYSLFYAILFLKIAVSILFFLFLPFIIALIVDLIILVLINILFSYNYNTIVIEKYLKDGYIPIGTESCDLLLKKGLYFRIE